MKILRFNNSKIEPVTTVPTTIKGKDHHTIRNGTFASGFWSYNFGISDAISKPDENKSPMELNGDNYMLIPLKKEGKQLKDANGNYIYFIGYDFEGVTKNNVLLFLRILNNRYIEVTYSVNGNANVIGEGTSGIIRDNKYYTSPAPVIEITDSCVISWTAKDEEGNTYKQNIFYKTGGEWDIGEIKKIENIKTN